MEQKKKGGTRLNLAIIFLSCTPFLGWVWMMFLTRSRIGLAICAIGLVFAILAGIAAAKEWIKIGEVSKLQEGTKVLFVAAVALVIGMSATGLIAATLMSVTI